MHLRKLWILIKSGIQGALEYRADIVVYTLSGATFPVIAMAIWIATLQTSRSLVNFGYTDLVEYFLLSIIVNILTQAWGAYFIANAINNGSYSMYLIKPFSLVEDWLANNISEKIFKVTLSIIGVGSLWYILIPHASLKLDLVTAILFLISLLLAATINFTLDLIIGITAFWVSDIDFLRNGIFIINQFFSGKIIPLYFLPAHLFGLLAILPFRYTLSFPLEILLQKAQGQDLLTGFIMEICWVVLLIVVFKILIREGEKSYQGYGI